MEKKNEMEEEMVMVVVVVVIVMLDFRRVSVWVCLNLSEKRFPFFPVCWQIDNLGIVKNYNFQLFFIFFQGVMSVRFNIQEGKAWRV